MADEPLSDSGRDLLDRMAEELARHGWGDFHYGAQPQEPRIVALLDEYRAWKATQ